MATKKLSQITPAAPTGPSDQIVGVIGGTTDALYSLSQLSTILPTPTPGAVINYYVSTTGSDTNNGLTVGAPFRSITHALYVAAHVDHLYAGGFPTINIAAGTYTLGSNGENINLQLPKLVGCLNGGVITGASSTTTIILDPSTNGVFSGINGPECEWNIGNLQTDTPSIHYGSSDLINIIINADVVCADRTSAGTGIIIDMIRGAHLTWGFGIITVTDTTFANFVRTHEGGRVTGFGATIVLPAANNTGGGAFFSNDFFGNGFIDFRGASVTNAASYAAAGTNARVQQAHGNLIILTANGVLADIPGTASKDVFDLGLQICATGGSMNTHWNAKAGLPANTDIPDGFWGVWKDTTGGGVYVAANDGGTIKKVALV